MKTVGDIKRMIASNMELGGLLCDHAEGLLVARETGSTTTIGLADVPDEVPVEMVHHPNVTGLNKCYKFHYPMGGELGAIPFRIAYSLGPVFIRGERHGIELCTYEKAEKIVGQSPDDIYVIVGPHEERGKWVDAVYTWHPGEPLGHLDDGIGPETGVKLVRS